MLQTIPGNGQTKSMGPYSVGCDYIIFNEDGTLPLRGACLWDNMPPGTKHISTVNKTGDKKGHSSITHFMVPLKQSSTNTMQKWKKSEESEYESGLEESEESDTED